MAKGNQAPQHMSPCRHLRDVQTTLAEITTNVRLLSESQARTDQAINRLTEALSIMAQHDGRLNHLESEAKRCNEHSVKLWEEVKDLRGVTNNALTAANTALEKGRDHGMTLRQIIP
ncbi:MAG: hypothetical protein HQL53_14405, partial [Magnetococcales bacterium]|nr:hypothetical protein [Magnetococcales bacterium]